MTFNWWDSAREWAGALVQMAFEWRSINSEDYDYNDYDLNWSDAQEGKAEGQTVSATRTRP